MQDLELGRGRQLGQTGIVTDSFLATNVIPANANRVALMLSGTALAFTAMVGLSVDPAGLKIVAKVADGQQFPIVLRIEDLGQIITGPLWGQGGGTGATLIWAEIISQVPYKTIP